jgi:hypothetical protein
MHVLRRSRRTPMVGDVFVLQPAARTYLFGRVIVTGANAGGFPNSNLIYIYRHRACVKAPVPVLHLTELLTPPMMTNRLPWSRGYFELVERRTLLPGDRYAKHTFSDERGRLFDETGRRLRRASGPVGDWGLQSYRTIDDVVSEALGIPLAEE